MAGVLVAKVNPKFLHAYSTSHTWPFSAIAELIDNAYDPDVSASQLWIDKEVINGKVCLTFVDDGNGMDLDHLHKMLSLGYCEKDTYETRPASHKPIGQYGNGFKSGSMRLAKDALVLTVHKEAATACVGLLSQTLCSQRNTDTVVLPAMEFTLPNLERSCNADLDMDRSLEAILEVSPYSNEDELKEELRKISKQKHGSGTKIVLFTLKWNKNGMLELDFESVPDDIRNPETQDDDPESSCQQAKVFEYRQSLRRYCSILFLTPKMEIFIRKKRVQSFVIKERLSRPSTMKYRPKGKNETEITFGRRSRRTDGVLEDYGMMFYHRNRLITPYVKLGCQTKGQTDDSRVGEVVGVVDVCDIIQPTNNKQEFLVNTVEYRTAKSALAKKLDQYCSQIDHHGDTEDEDRNTPQIWVQCNQCRKWRLIPTPASEPVPNPWHCHMNPDLTRNRCDFPEEEFSDEETDTTRTPGSSSMSSSRGRGRGGRRRIRGIKSAAILLFDSSDSSSDASTQESDSVPATAAPTTPATTSQGPEVVSRRKRKQPAYHRTVGDKRARSIRDVKGQGNRVGIRGMRDVPTPRQVRLLARHVTQALFTSSNDQGSNGQGSNDQGSNGQASTSHHAPSVVTDDDPGDIGHDKDDDTGVGGHDEDDDMGVSGHDEDDDTVVIGHGEDDELRRFHRFRGNVHTLLSLLVDRQMLNLPAVGPLEKIEDYVQRMLTSLRPPLE